MDKAILIFGRLHFMLVHMPVAFILLSFLFELLCHLPRFSHLAKAISLILLLSFFTSILSVVSGYLISNEGGYDLKTLQIHGYLGALTTMGTILVFYFRKIANRMVKKSGNTLKLVLQIGLFLVMTIAGHTGGYLTHGKDFLLPKSSEADFLPNKSQDEKLLFETSQDVPLSATECL
jgi:uncharacterized membrane protein